jgi:cellulose synthase/poly-beta-1,6-N-acetylglucosamine synthase-like glycosyltransferase
MTPLASGTWWNPYAGLPVVIQVGFVIALVITVLSLTQLVVLRVKARTARRMLARIASSPEALGEEDFLWVFLVPALNEEVTIADSVARLREVRATSKVVIVIDDGSDDATPDLLAAMDDPFLVVLRRDPPDARRGKAAALNNAWHHVHDVVLTAPEHRHHTPERVVVVIVDADGRLEAGSPARVAPHFIDPRTAGVQTQVRIYNRHRWLTWAQDVEFSVFGLVFQLGRTAWGTAHMGGNGQFNRLAALDAVATDEGPWRHRLTEDQDIGLRLIEAGWHGHQEVGTFVSQQGLTVLRPLYRQRTRWAQGSWQAMSLFGTVRRARVSPLARIDMIGYLLLPALQMYTALALVTAIVIALTTDIGFWAAGWPIVVFFLVTTAGPGLVALLARGRGVRGLVVALACLLPYTVYSWLTFPAIARGLVRQLTGRGSWAKTAREPLEAEPEIEAELP